MFMKKMYVFLNYLFFHNDRIIDKMKRNYYVLVRNLVYADIILCSAFNYCFKNRVHVGICTKSCYL